MEYAKKLAELGKEKLEAGRAQVESLRYGVSGASSDPVATMGDEEARRAQGFHEVEATLPKQMSASSETPLLDRVLSFAFGEKNPVAKEADPETDVVWLLDNVAYRPEGQGSAHWEAEFVAAFFARHTGRDLSGAVANIADKIGVDDGHLGEKAEAHAIIEKRLRPFALSIRPARFVEISWAGAETRQLGPGDSNGISSQVLGQLGFRGAGEVIHSGPLTKDIAPHGPMSTFFVEPTGWTVISGTVEAWEEWMCEVVMISVLIMNKGKKLTKPDIDDSIKITMTSSPIGMLQSTFYDQPTPIKGMPELYKHIQAKFEPNWFYLSASPYTLYSFLRPFLRDNYPHGPLFLRDASWQDLTGLLQSFTVGTEAYKTSRIEKFHSWLPQRKVICVGDSTQSDPESYGSMYRKYPGWIKAIFIRKVTGVTGMDVAKKNAPERFEKSFKDVPQNVWKVFEDPSELYQAVDALTA